MILNKIRQKYLSEVGAYQSHWMSRRQNEFMQDLSFSYASSQFTIRNRMHAYMHHYFSQICPVDVRMHRDYFKRESRGFGEDAFHAMWFLLMREFRPASCLEIGVYRGQVISLWALLSRHLGFPCSIYGISPFTPAGDHVSTYLSNIDYRVDTVRNHEVFNLPAPNLLTSFSTDQESLTLISSKPWDLIYIDGSHDYEVALADYEICRENLTNGGLLVIDDSSLYTDYRPPMFSFAGHPGPSRIVKERVMHEMQFLGAVGHNNIFIKGWA